MNPPSLFDGPEFDERADALRLTGQIRRVADCMKDEQWRTLSEIATWTGDPEASVSAQLRHLRKEKFGKHTVDRQRRGIPARRTSGLWEYRLRIRKAGEERIP